LNFILFNLFFNFFFIKFNSQIEITMVMSAEYILMQNPTFVETDKSNLTGMFYLHQLYKKLLKRWSEIFNLILLWIADIFFKKKCQTGILSCPQSGHKDFLMTINVFACKFFFLLDDWNAFESTVYYDTKNMIFIIIICNADLF
jgi:hypothetical protein